MLQRDTQEHQNAYKVYEKLRKENYFVIIPYSGLFEVLTVLKRDKVNKGRLQFVHDQNFELQFKPIPIDDKFFDRYNDPDLPYTKTGDMLFLAIAKKENAPLITEDKKLYEAAKQCRVKVYKINDFLNS